MSPTATIFPSPCTTTELGRRPSKDVVVVPSPANVVSSCPVVGRHPARNTAATAAMAAAPVDALTWRITSLYARPIIFIRSSGSDCGDEVSSDATVALGGNGVTPRAVTAG